MGSVEQPPECRKVVTLERRHRRLHALVLREDVARAALQRRRQAGQVGHRGVAQRTDAEGGGRPVALVASRVIPGRGV